MGTMEEHAKKSDISGMMVTAMITALTLVVGLFWNDVVKSAIEEFMPEEQKILAKFIAAIIVTVVVVVAIFILIKTEELSKKHGKELARQVNDLKLTIRKQRALIDRQKMVFKKGSR
ncbi:MAG: DUF5654 family protein [Candidatus Aenigmatarchaeota archaeon]